MPNELSADEVIVGDLKVLTGGQVQKVVQGTIARTDTAAKSLGKLPAGSVIIGIELYGPTSSDAGTTATVSLGFSGGSGTELLNAFDVKGSGSTQQIPTGAKLNQPSPLATTAETITGTYAETGGASTTGGPWLVVIEFVTPTS